MLRLCARKAATPCVVRIPARSVGGAPSPKAISRTVTKRHSQLAAERTAAQSGGTQRAAIVGMGGAVVLAGGLFGPSPATLVGEKDRASTTALAHSGHSEKPLPYADAHALPGSNGNSSALTAGLAATGHR